MFLSSRLLLDSDAKVIQTFTIYDFRMVICRMFHAQLPFCNFSSRPVMTRTNSHKFSPKRKISKNFCFCCVSLHRMTTNHCCMRRGVNEGKKIKHQLSSYSSFSHVLSSSFVRSLCEHIFLDDFMHERRERELWKKLKQHHHANTPFIRSELRRSSSSFI